MTAFGCSSQRSLPFGSGRFIPEVLLNHILHDVAASSAYILAQIEIWECSGAAKLSEAAVEAARREADSTTNASGARLLVTLEPPVKPKDAYWGGSGGSAAEDADAAAADAADAKGALEKILKGKTGADAVGGSTARNHAA